MKVVNLNAKDINRHKEAKRVVHSILSNRIHRLITKSSIGLLALAALMWAAPAAHAGAIRYAGKMIMQGTNAAAAATTSGGEAAADGAVQYAGKMIMQGTNAAAAAAASGGESAADRATSAAQATGGVLGNALGATGNAVRGAGKDAGDAVVLGASATVWGARQAPGIVARKTSAAARSIWHAIW